MVSLCLFLPQVLQLENEYASLGQLSSDASEQSDWNSSLFCLSNFFFFDDRDSPPMLRYGWPFLVLVKCGWSIGM